MGKWKGRVKEEWEGSGGRDLYFASDRAVFRLKHAPSRWSSPDDRHDYMAGDLREASF